MNVLIGVGVLTLLIIVIRFLTKRRRTARKTRKAEYRQQKKQVRYRTAVKTRGIITADTYCPDCGLPKTRCKRAQKQAEHATGMLGKKK